jgi:hypothetical protein
VQRAATFHLIGEHWQKEPEMVEFLRPAIQLRRHKYQFMLVEHITFDNIVKAPALEYTDGHQQAKITRNGSLQ